MCGDVLLSLDLLKKRRYNKRTVKKFYPKERGAELKSKNQSMDMTQGVIWKQLAYFALPLFLGNLCQQLYNTADSIIVGKFVGKDALAAVSSSGNLIFMMTGFFMGLFVGAGVIISRYFGAKCYDRLEAAVHTDLAFAMVCGVLLMLVGIFLTPQILVWMRTPEDVLPQSIQYFRLYFMGSLFMIVYNACMGILQAVGDSRSPLRYLIISSITNVTLDLIFVGALKWGVNGAAIATVVSQMVSAVLCFRKLMRADGPYRLVPKRIRFELPMLKQITAQGIPSGVQNSIIAIANVVVQSNINTFGSDAMAGCGSYAKVEGFVFLPITSFAMALTNLEGLVCDPVAGLVEIPCIKRNVIGAMNAVSCADMALAGVVGHIPADEVIDAMAEVGAAMSNDLRETGIGGLAGTPTGKAIRDIVQMQG